jgi:hypothetical protein
MNTVLQSFAYCLDYLREQVADVRPIGMVEQPNGIINHPAWVIGHLTFSCQAIGGEFGMTPWLPSSWAKRFGTGSVPLADATAYEPKEDSLELLRDAEARIVEAVRQLSEAELDAPLPDEAYRVTLPTLRHAITQVLVGHPSYHVGQLTLWRQAVGLPSISRPFA